MQMNALIPMQVQSPDLVGSMARGVEAARMANTAGRENALANLYRTQGAGIMAGDQNALNALAQQDPAAALGIQSARQSMALEQKRFDVLSAQERRAAEEYARRLSAQEAQAQAAQIEQGVKMGMAAQSPQQWDALMQQYSPDLVGQFGNRQMLASKYMGWADILKGGDQFRQATPEEAAKYGSAGGQFGPDGRFYPINPPSGMSVEIGADGQAHITQGPGAGAGGKPFTEAQSKDNVYSTRARGALDAFEPVADAMASRKDRALDYVPLGFGREMQGDNFQVAQQAGTEFLQAILRKDTGAAITNQETESYGRVYLPQPGDGKAVLDAKREARTRAVAALESGMSPAQMLARDSALVKAARETAGAKPGNLAAPDVGAVIDGYRFNGGDAADPKNWQKVE